MESLIKQIKQLNLCLEDEFFDFIKKYCSFTDDLELAGIYENKDKVVIVIPRITNNLTMSIAIHEAGHLYDYYKVGKILESEDTALDWEFKFLFSKGEYELINNRISEIISNSDSLKYKTIIKRS